MVRRQLAAQRERNQVPDEAGSQLSHGAPCCDGVLSGVKARASPLGTLRPGACYSACAMTFLGGAYRFIDNGGRYGVHRASLLGGPAGERDLGPELSSAIGSYIREMGVDPRLLDLCLKANRDEMYVLSSLEAKALMVANNGDSRRNGASPRLPGARGCKDGKRRSTATGPCPFLRRHANCVRRRVRIRPSRRSERGVDMAASADDRKVGRDPRGGAERLGPGWRRALDVRPAAEPRSPRDVGAAHRVSDEAGERSCPVDRRPSRCRREICRHGQAVPGRLPAGSEVAPIGVMIQSVPDASRREGS